MYICHYYQDSRVKYLIVFRLVVNLRRQAYIEYTLDALDRALDPEAMMQDVLNKAANVCHIRLIG
jgi:hypothetical protein